MDKIMENFLKAHKEHRFKHIDVEVTQKHCDRANRGHPQTCAISVALKDKFPKAAFVSTEHYGLTMTYDGHYLHYVQTRKGSSVIDLFDRDLLPPPVKLSFNLYNIEKAKEQTQARKDQVNAARKKRKAEGRPDRRYHGGGGDPLRLRIAKSIAAKRSKKTAELELV